MQLHIQGLLLISALVGCTAHALGDPSVTIEEVTPPVSASGPLFPTEVHVKLHNSTVPIFISYCSLITIGLGTPLWIMASELMCV